MNNLVYAKVKKGIKASKKRELYRQYKKILKSNGDVLLNKHNIRIDWIHRMWKVYNVPVDEQGNIYHYGSKYLNELVKKDLSSIDKTFMSMGLLELSALIETVVIDDYNVKVVISFKHFDLLKRIKRRILFFSILTFVVTFFSILFMIL
jgi:hypothetical protein